MAIYSLTQSSQGLKLVEVEVQLVRGMPNLQVLGRPDSSIKECALRLKTAFQNLGWEWPRNQQIVVNLKPAHLRKESSGLDLAIALGIRIAQEELDLKTYFKNSDVVAFGEVDLQGNISAPRELAFWEGTSTQIVLTGPSSWDFHFDVFEISNLVDIKQATKRPAKNFTEFLTPPLKKEFFFSKKAARLLEITSSGEHSLLLAGPAGSGKSTWAEALGAMLPPPFEKEFLKARIFHLRQKRELKWRPFLQPHHSASSISLVGGGVPPRPGAFTLAHGGVLLMDEYLEFTKDIQEALREPMEKAEVHLFRGTEMVVYPSRFQLIATTNLCPCGNFEPGKIVSCNTSLRRCRSIIERLSGPVVDRFDILHFTSEWGPKEIHSENIDENIQRALKFRKQRGQSYPNALLPLTKLTQDLPTKLKPYLPEPGSSQRRLRALLRVARSLADINENLEIGVKELNEAMELTWSPFEQLKQC